MPLPSRRTNHLAEAAREVAADAMQMMDEVDALDFASAIIAASTVEDSIGAVLGQLVAAHRDEGATWEQIGTLLGVSRQSAWERFRAVDPPVPPDYQEEAIRSYIDRQPPQSEG